MTDTSARSTPAAAPGRPGRVLAAWPMARVLWVQAVAVAVVASLLAAGVAALLPGWGVAGAAAGGALGALALGLPWALLVQRSAAAPAASVDPAGVMPRREGAASRDFLVDIATREFARARRYGTGAALLVVEVDRWGRPAERLQGPPLQALLQALAAEVAPTLRGADVLAYHDPAQLAVFLVQADQTGALDVAERIRERAEMLSLPWTPEPLRCTVSVGVAHLRPAHESVQALFDDAADAVQAAREVGGNCVRAAPVERLQARNAGLASDRPGA